MKCPKCGSNIARVTTVFHKSTRTYRYRQCNKCNYKFKTVELISDGMDYKHVVEKIRDLVNETQDKPSS